MSEYVPFLLLVVTIIIAFFDHQQNQKLIRQQAQEIEELKQGRRKELIIKYYPPLAEDLRLSLSDVTYRYIQGYQEHGHYFEVLIGMANESTLKTIQGLDEILYNDLKQILDHFFPAEKEIDRKKDESWEALPQKWQKWIEDNYNTLPNMGTTPEALSKELANGLRWAIWRNEENILRQNFDSSFEANFELEDDEEKHVEPKMYMLSKIMQIAEEEWNLIKDEYEKLHEELKTLITSKILPRMDDTLQSLGE